MNTKEAIIMVGWDKNKSKVFHRQTYFNILTDPKYRNKILNRLIKETTAHNKHHRKKVVIAHAWTWGWFNSKKTIAVLEIKAEAKPQPEDNQ